MSDIYEDIFKSGVEAFAKLSESVAQIAKNTTPPEQIENQAFIDIHQGYYTALMDIMYDSNLDTLKKFTAIRLLMNKSAESIKALSQ